MPYEMAPTLNDPEGHFSCLTFKPTFGKYDTYYPRYMYMNRESGSIRGL